MTKIRYSGAQRMQLHFECAHKSSSWWADKIVTQTRIAAAKPVVYIKVCPSEMPEEEDWPWTTAGSFQYSYALWAGCLAEYRARKRVHSGEFEDHRFIALALFQLSGETFSLGSDEQ